MIPGLLLVIRARADGLAVTLPDEADPGLLESAARAPAADAADMTAPSPAAPPEASGLSLRLALRYRDSSGAESERRVTVARVWRARRDIYVQGRCHLRRATRMFRASRILSLWDPDTGEILDPAAAYFGRFLRAPADPTDAALGACRPELALLARLARADGVMMAEEAEAVVDYVEARAGFAVDRDRARAEILRLRADAASADDALAALGDFDEARAAAFARALVRVSAIDGILDDAEFDFLLAVRAALEEAGPPAADGS